MLVVLPSGSVGAAISLVGSTISSGMADGVASMSSTVVAPTNCQPRLIPAGMPSGTSRSTRVLNVPRAGGLLMVRARAARHMYVCIT